MNEQTYKTEEKEPNKNKLVGKILITGQIKAVTGLHIGGTKTALEIGSVDLNVIKTAQGVPFIPGSSLKGKLRSLLAKEIDSKSTKNDASYIKELFGESGTEKDRGTPARLIVRDAFAILDSNRTMYKGEDFENLELELGYTEVKWENRINRITGKAEDPRQIERVPAGATFAFELVYDVYEDVIVKYQNSKDQNIDSSKHLVHLKRAMQLLQDDYIGGHGSRGYGKIQFLNIETKFKQIYGEGEAGKPYEYKQETASQTIYDLFKEI